MNIEPYLFFEGRCEEAIEHYRKALGAEIEMLLRYRDSPQPPPPGTLPPGSESKVMHASVKIGDTRVMLSDGHCGGQQSFQGFAISITTTSAADVDRMFGALAADGEVRQPLTETFFSPRFGMVTDRFGVLWVISVPGAP